MREGYSDIKPKVSIKNVIYAFSLVKQTLLRV
jgi:hypothetical protein